MCCHSRGKGKHKWLLQPFAAVSVPLCLEHASHPPAVKAVFRLAFISSVCLFLTRHAGSDDFRAVFFFPSVFSLTNGRASLLA